MTRLNQDTLATLPPAVVRAPYDRAQVNIGIVHLGLGAFHRAHMAAYVDACLGDDPSWGICGVSLRSAATYHLLEPQDGLYTLGVDGGQGLYCQVIGAVKKVLVAPQQPQALLARLVAPTTRIVSLTITEKGYCHDPATGDLNVSHPDIAHDLASDGYPRSAVGWLVHALAQRKANHTPAFTVLSCDNLPSNGALLRRLLLQFAQIKSPDLVTWLSTHLACPSTMVDRIVPAVTKEGQQKVEAVLGVRDVAPVVTEPFSQFVIEDHFPTGRPDWQQHGVTMVEDVEPFELMKLRMLNGSHSTLAYLGCLAGYQTVADCMAAPELKAFVHAMMVEEIAPTLTMPDSVDLAGYAQSLIARFDNVALHHRTEQIAMDGSQKLPQRLLGTISDRLTAGLPFPRLALGVAAWMAYVSRKDAEGEPIVVNDPLADQLATLANKSGPSAEDKVEAFLTLESVFGTRLPAETEFRSEIVHSLQAVEASGGKIKTALTSV